MRRTVSGIASWELGEEGASRSGLASSAITDDDVEVDLRNGHRPVDVPERVPVGAGGPPSRATNGNGHGNGNGVRSEGDVEHS